MAISPGNATISHDLGMAHVRCAQYHQRHFWMWLRAGTCVALQRFQYVEAPNVTLDGFWLSTLPSRSIMILVKYHEYMLASDGGGLPLIARVDSPNAQYLVVEIYDAKGRLVARSLPSAGTVIATAPALLPGIYPVRVRSIGVLPIDYLIKLITTVPRF